MSAEPPQAAEKRTFRYRRDVPLGEIALPRPWERGVRCFRSAVRIVLHAGGTDMKLPRRNFLHLAAGAAALPAMPRFASAQAYPTRPVRIIVGFLPGGPNDVVARLIGQWLSERFGQPFIVVYRPSDVTNIAWELV